MAHSQGNLFVNSAFDALKSVKPDVQAQVVHVAPASPTLRGDHVLADIDLVINGLRITGLSRVPSANIHLPLSKINPSGHSFEPTYLDKARAAYASTIGMITFGGPVDARRQERFDLCEKIEVLPASIKECAKQTIAYNRTVSGRLPEGDTCEP